MDVIRFDSLAQEVADALPREDVDFTAVNEYSDIDVVRQDFTLGGRFTTRSGVVIDVGYMHVDYDDDDPLLTDDSGEYDVFFANLGYSF